MDPETSLRRLRRTLVAALPLPREPNGSRGIGSNTVLLAHPYPREPHDPLPVSDHGNRPAQPARHLVVCEEVGELARSGHPERPHPVSRTNRVDDQRTCFSGIDRDRVGIASDVRGLNHLGRDTSGLAEVGVAG